MTTKESLESRRDKIIQDLRLERSQKSDRIESKSSLSSIESDSMHRQKSPKVKIKKLEKKIQKLENTTISPTFQKPNLFQLISKAPKFNGDIREDFENWRENVLKYCRLWN